MYNEVVHNGWAKIYSRMLDIIVPNAVMFELNHKHRAEEAATKRFKDVSKAEAVVATQARSDGSTIFNNRSANAAGHSTSATPPHSIGMNSGGPAVKTSAPSAAAEKARVGVKAPPKEDGLRTPTMDHEEDDKKPEADDATHNSSSRGSAKALQDNSRKARENVEILGAASRR